VSFKGCFLVAASFRRCSLGQASFVGAYVRNADFTEADLSGADFADADWFNVLGLTRAVAVRPSRNSFGLSRQRPKGCALFGGPLRASLCILGSALQEQLRHLERVLAARGPRDMVLKGRQHPQ